MNTAAPDRRCNLSKSGGWQVATKEDIALMAHLMRRAGFGATRDELEKLVEQGYEETVEQLLHPEEQPQVNECMLYRYHPITEGPQSGTASGQANWLYHMLNTERLLEEKMALFWHHVFATGNSKVDITIHMLEQIPDVPRLRDGQLQGTTCGAR